MIPDTNVLQLVAAIDVVIVGVMAMGMLTQQREIGDLKERIARLETKQQITVNLEESGAGE